MSEDIERMIAEVVEADEVPQPLANNPAAPAPVQVAPTQRLFEDEEMLALCSEAVSNMRGDRKQLDTLISNFVEMVFNEGDSTTASKEALVALMVAKTNMSDKQMKLIELIAKFKLKEMADAPKTVTSTAQEHYHFGSRRSFLEQIDKRIKKKKTEEKNNA